MVVEVPLCVILFPGLTKDVDAFAYQPDDTVISGQSVNWTTSDGTVATVSPASGTMTTITGVGAGQATITATIAAAPPAIPAPITATVLVTVVPKVVRLELALR